MYLSVEDCCAFLSHIVVNKKHIIGPSRPFVRPYVRTSVPIVCSLQPPNELGPNLDGLFSGTLSTSMFQFCFKTPFPPSFKYHCFNRSMITSSIPTFARLLFPTCSLLRSEKLVCWLFSYSLKVIQELISAYLQ